MPTLCNFRIQSIGPREDVQALRRLLSDWVVPCTDSPRAWELYAHAIVPDSRNHSTLLLTDEHAHRACWCQFSVHGSYSQLVLTGRSSSGPPVEIVEQIAKRFTSLRCWVEGHVDGHSYERYSIRSGQRHETDYCRCDRPETPDCRHTAWCVVDGERLETPEVVPAIDEGGDNACACSQ